MTVRADVVGSLLRPEYLKQARASASPEELRAAEDRAVREAVALQEAVGVDVLGDGEMRRWSWIGKKTTDLTLSQPPTSPRTSRRWLASA